MRQRDTADLLRLSDSLACDTDSLLSRSHDKEHNRWLQACAARLTELPRFNGRGVFDLGYAIEAFIYESYDDLSVMTDEH